MGIFLSQSPSAEITSMSHHIWLAERPFLEDMGQDTKKRANWFSLQYKFKRQDTSRRQSAMAAALKLHYKNGDQG